MKFFSIFTAAVLSAGLALAQSTALPETEVKQLSNNQKIAFNKTFEKDKVTVVNFWATWCVPCKKEIASIRKRLPDWQNEVPFNYMTVSVDETRAEGLARSYAKSQGWDFPYYIDPNSDLKRSLNFQTVPFTIIVDKTGKVAYMHAGYEEGNEEVIWEKVKELAK